MIRHTLKLEYENYHRMRSALDLLSSLKESVCFERGYIKASLTLDLDTSNCLIFSTYWEGPEYINAFLEAPIYCLICKASKMTTKSAKVVLEEVRTMDSLGTWNP